MATETINDGVQAAGDIDIADLTLITMNGTQIDLKPFLIELNITEDIFSTSLYGNIMLTDSIGIMEHGPIIGEEYLRVDVGTPGMDARISKTFRVYNVSDRNVIIDDKTQTFILHFCSPEVIVDTMAKIYKTFSGRVDEVAATIYTDYLQTARNIQVNAQTNQFVESEDATSLTLLNETDNQIKFTCPGWGAMKTLSWLASKGVAKDTKAADNLFYETSQGFYWGSVGTIFQAYRDQKTVAAEFYYSPSNIRARGTGSLAVSGVQYKAPDLNHEYKIMQDFVILDTFNTLKANQLGYYANQVLTVDLINKTYKYNNFDYVKDFDKYPHMEKYAPFTPNQFRNPGMVTETVMQHPGLYSDDKENISERVAGIKQNRMSLLAGLSNIRIEGSVPGRSDFEAGSVVYFGMPKMGPKGPEDKAEEYDTYLSGLYLVTCVRHKITYLKHVMNCEFVKESFSTPLK